MNQSGFGGPRASESALTDALLAPASSLMAPDRAEVLAHQRAYFDALEAAGERPLWEFSFDRSPWFERGPGGLGDLPEVFSVLAAAADRAIASRQVAWHRLQAVRAAVALERFRLAEGRWPDALNELVPRFLPSVPLDPFDGNPLRYRLEDGSPVLWSIGHDRVDDGGMLNARVGTAANAGADAAAGPAGAAEAPDAMDDRDAASAWKRRDIATDAVAERDAGRQPAWNNPIHFGDWIIFAPGWDWQAESDAQSGKVSHLGG